MATKRVVINRSVLTEATLAVGDGLFELSKKIIESAHPPDAPPFGKGLLEGGGSIAYAGRRKIAGTKIGNKEISKPRSLMTQPKGITVAGGFGFPGRFVELGTNDTPAQPFLTPALLAARADALPFVRAAVKRRRALGHR